MYIMRIVFADQTKIKNQTHTDVICLRASVNEMGGNCGFAVCAQGIIESRGVYYIIYNTYIYVHKGYTSLLYCLECVMAINGERARESN